MNPRSWRSPVTASHDANRERDDTSILLGVFIGADIYKPVRSKTDLIKVLNIEKVIREVRNTQLVSIPIERLNFGTTNTDLLILKGNPAVLLMSVYRPVSILQI